jgi:DNA-binding beta-propeller fold protein YncE
VGPDGDLYVADFYNQRVQHMTPDGRFIRQWGQTREDGASPGSFNYPTDVALGPDGTLYVADGYNDRIQAFAADGTYARRWGGPFGMNIYGPFNGWFSTVSSVAVDGAGNVFVADFYNHRVQKFISDGHFLTAFKQRGDGAGEMIFRNAIAMAPNGFVFVADFGNNRIQKWAPAE